MQCDFMVQRGPVRTLFQHWNDAAVYAAVTMGAAVKVGKG